MDENNTLKETALLICKNCGNQFYGKYCNTCGQKFINERNTVKHILNLFISTFDIYRGFFYTTKLLLIYPKKVINEYLNGRTKDFTNPLKFLFIIAGFSALITVWSNIFETSVQNTNQLLGATGDSLKFQAKIIGFLQSYLNIFTILFIPFYSIISRWLLKKQKLYYAEHLIINSYFYAQNTLLNFIPLALILLFPSLIVHAQFVGIFVFLIYYTYALKKTFQIPLFSSFIKAVLINFLGMLLIVLLSLLLMILFFIFYKLLGRDLKSILT